MDNTAAKSSDGEESPRSRWNKEVESLQLKMIDLLDEQNRLEKETTPQSQTRLAGVLAEEKRVQARIDELYTTGLKSMIRRT